MLTLGALLGENNLSNKLNRNIGTSASGIGRIGIKVLNVHQVDRLHSHSVKPILNGGEVPTTVMECHSSSISISNTNGSHQNGMARIITAMGVVMEVAK